MVDGGATKTPTKKDYSGLAVVREMKFDDARYGNCSECGQPVVIPGLSHSFCQHCGWVERKKDVDVDNEAPPSTGHHN